MIAKQRTVPRPAGALRVEPDLEHLVNRARDEPRQLQVELLG